ncbi:hypothetical protein STXM2123_5568 [Streptomyces sp. F-3]|nr:hypothetical protein STXM2123_5568 [Streptomyces sp. F-3]
MSAGPGSPRGGAAPSHQPPHRRLHTLWATSAPHEPVLHAATKEAHGRGCGATLRALCAPPRAPVERR